MLTELNLFAKKTKKTKTLAANLLGNFGPALTYEVFIHLGLVLAIPVSAGE